MHLYYHSTYRYTPVKACLHKVAAAIEQRGTDWPEEWPKRLETFPEWLADSEDKLTKDHEHWKAIIDKSYLAGLGIDWSNIRNVMDMKAIYGGYVRLSQTKNFLGALICFFHYFHVIKIRFSQCGFHEV